MKAPQTKTRRRAARTILCGTALSASLVINAATAAPQLQAAGSTVVARSSEETAATGRRPISARIAVARKPISIPQPPATPPAAEETPAIQAAPSLLSDQTLSSLAGEGVTEAAPIEQTPPPQPTETAAPQTVPPVTIGGLLYPPSVVAQAQSPEPGTFSAVSAVTLQVEESQARATVGGTIEWRLKLCNASSEPASNVTAVLFFAEGIEPVAASGAEASLAAGEVRFAPVQTLTPGEVVELHVTGIGTDSGEVPYRAEVAMNERPETIAHDGVVRVGDSPQRR